MPPRWLSCSTATRAGGVIGYTVMPDGRGYRMNCHNITPSSFYEVESCVSHRLGAERLEPSCGMQPQHQQSGKVLMADGYSYDGQSRNGKPHGKGKLTWPSGSCYVGEFNHGLMHGSGLLTYAEDGKPDPQGSKYTWNAGDCYDGSFRDGTRHGDCTYTFFNGEVFCCEWRRGQCPEFSTRQAEIWANETRLINYSMVATLALFCLMNEFCVISHVKI